MMYVANNDEFSEFQKHFEKKSLSFKKARKILYYSVLVGDQYRGLNKKKS